MPFYSGWFSSKESAGGDPRWLYTASRANRVWRLTSDTAPVTVTATGLTYEPGIITRGRVERSQEHRADTITLQVARTTDFADALRAVNAHPISLLIEKYQPGDAGALPVVEARGAAANVRLQGYGWILFDLVRSAQRFNQPFPSKLVERQCQWPAFSAESGIDERAFSYATTITSITGSKVVVDSIGLGYSGYYYAGQLKFGDDATAERAFVDYHIGRDFYLVGPLPDSVTEAYAAFLLGGDPVAVTLIAGDDRTLATRRDKFGGYFSDAVDNFLGFDLLPASDPLQTGLTNAPVALAPYTGTSPTPPVPTSSGGLPFRVMPMRTETDADGTLTLDVFDPVTLVVSVEARTNPTSATGAPGDWTAWADMPVIAVPGDPLIDPTRYALTAARGGADYIAIEARITYDDGTTHVVNGLWEFLP